VSVCECMCVYVCVCVSVHVCVCVCVCWCISVENAYYRSYLAVLICLNYITSSKSHLSSSQSLCP
jgi:hypothetical protein